MMHDVEGLLMMYEVRATACGPAPPLEVDEPASPVARADGKVGVPCLLSLEIRSSWLCRSGRRSRQGC
jgi:hypothetical protein